MICVVGSKALNHHRYIRPSKDVDLIGSYDDLDAYIKSLVPVSYYPIKGGKKLFAKLSDGTIIEAEIAWGDGKSSDGLVDLIDYDPLTTYLNGLNYPSLNILYMLKMSHRYLKNSVHFLKTMDDIHLMRSMGAVIQDDHKAFYSLRQRETYDYGHPKLNVTKDGFFRDVDLYVYPHDDIHAVMALGDRPAYDYYKADQNEVLTSKEMFFSVDESVRLAGVIEEVYVLALERSLIPNDYRPDPYKAFLKSLQCVCTSITSGYFREFSWENYRKIVDMYDAGYVDRFRKAVSEGGILPIAK